MIKIDRAIIVEGKYDKIKLLSYIDAPIFTTRGFGIFKDKQLQSLIRELCDKRGLLVLTDSDSAGFQIRNFISSIADKNKIINAYIPDIFGKEKRKDTPSKEGKIGVEGVSESDIMAALENCGVLCESVEEKKENISKALFYELGLTGADNSTAKRRKVLSHYNLPELMTTNSLITALCCITTANELRETCNKLFSEN